MFLGMQKLAQIIVWNANLIRAVLMASVGLLTEFLENIVFYNYDVR